MLFAVVVGIQSKEISEYCFKCNHMLLGALRDDILGEMLPCRQELCPHEEKRSEVIGKCLDGEVCLRKLKVLEVDG